MRRIASVFASRRSDKQDTPPASARTEPPSPSAKTHLMPAQPNKKSARLFGSVARITVSTSAAHPLPPLEGHSSSSSSTGSASLRTPEDDRASPVPQRTPSGRWPWIPWLGGKKPAVEPPPALPGRPHWLNAQAANVPAPIHKPRLTLKDQVESEDDTSESAESESELTPQPNPIERRTLLPVDFIVAFTANNLAPAFSPPPLLHPPNSALFPRSCNASRQLSTRDSLECEIHRKRLLRRLQQEPLSPLDQRLLAAYGPRVASAAVRRTLPQPDEAARLNLRHVESQSRGLKRWIARPYFEERMAVWMPQQDTGEVNRSPVKGSGFGVWALDISVALEELAGYEEGEVGIYGSPSAVDETASDPPSSASSSSSQLSASMPAVTKQVPYRALPSPLRNDSESSYEHPLTVLKPPSSRTISPLPESISSAFAPKRGVRFAESVEKEDQVPLEYVQRHQRKREERAKFLRQEQERRRHEEERRLHDAERLKWEQEKQQWQKEKQAIEDARKQKLYAEEVVAARARRETQHGVASYGAAGGSNREADRRRDSYTRPVYDARRQSTASGDSQSLHPSRPRNDSSGSRQGSLPRSDNGSPHASSRPPSTFSTHSFSSAEDPTRMNRNSASRRGSMISESSQRVAYPVYPYGWNGMPAVPPLPQVPMMPIFPAYPAYPSMPMMPVMPPFAMDMPLLPPSPPFMHGSRSRNSSPSSPSRSRPSQPNHSSDRINHSSSSPSRGHERQRSVSDDIVRGRAPHPQTNPHPDDRRGSRGPPSQAPSSSTTRTTRTTVPHSASLDTVGLSQSASSQNRPYASRRRTAFS